jgi:hypothetical protein
MFARRFVAVLGALLIASGIMVAPGTATAPKGRPLTITVVGTQGLKPAIRVRGPNGFTRVVRVDAARILRTLKPGRYTLTAATVGDLAPADAVKKVRVRKNRAASVTFRYRGPDTTAPGPVTDLRLVSRTATSIRLKWTNPPDGTFLQVEVTRRGGTDAETGTIVLDQDGTGMTEDGLNPDTEYTYTVAAEDEAGNVGPRVSITVRTLPA